VHLVRSASSGTRGWPWPQPGEGVDPSPETRSTPQHSLLARVSRNELPGVACSGSSGRRPPGTPQKGPSELRDAHRDGTERRTLSSRQDRVSRSLKRSRSRRVEHRSPGHPALGPHPGVQPRCLLTTFPWSAMSDLMRGGRPHWVNHRRSIPHASAKRETCSSATSPRVSTSRPTAS